jgi:putative membrane protein
LLAWVRTSIAIIGLGFIVARFGLLLRELGATNPHPLPTGVSTVIGVALTVCGVIVLLSLQRYRTVGDGIERDDYHWAPQLAIALTLVLAAAGYCWRSTSSSPPEATCAICAAWQVFTRSYVLGMWGGMNSFLAANR